MSVYHKLILHICALDYTTVVVSLRGLIPLTGLTTPVRWLSLPQMTVLSRNFGGVFVLSGCVLDLYVGVGGFVIGVSQIFSFSPSIIQTLVYVDIYNSDTYVDIYNTRVC